MPAAVQEFGERLVSAGLLRADELPGLKASANGAADDPRAFADHLVSTGRLTRYQADVVVHQLPDPILLGDYLVLDRIGEGGMGQVYKARHLRMHRIVAVKLVASRKLDDTTAVRRFQREVEASGRLNHPNIVASLDAREQEGRHYLVMEYVEGGDLAALVAKHGPLPIDHAVSCVLQAARGLEYAHTHGVVHRDIKPSNLLLDRDGVVKILDLGLARIEHDAPLSEEEELTGTGSIMGTVDFMAPEQAIDTKHVDARADIYSLGCTLYYLAAGRKPFDADSVMKKLMAHRERPIPLLASIRPDAPPAVDELLRRMLAKSPEDRFQTMGEVCKALQACLPDGVDSMGRTSEFFSAVVEKSIALAYEPRPALLKQASTSPPSRTRPQSSPPASAAAGNRRAWIGATVVLVSAGVAALVWRPWSDAPKPDATETNPAAATKTAEAAEPISPVAASPTEVEIARWVVRNRGQVARIGSGLQPADFTSGIESLADGFEVGGVSFSDTSIADADLERLTHLPNLTYLNLHGTPITNDGCRHVARMSALANLYLGETKIDAAGLRLLGTLTKLKFLNVVGLPLDDAVVGGWPVLTELTTLHAAQTKLADDGLRALAEFPKLQTLGLENTKISDAGLAHLQRRPSLKRIIVTHTNVSREGIEALRRSVPGIQIEGAP